MCRFCLLVLMFFYSRWGMPDKRVSGGCYCKRWEHKLEQLVGHSLMISTSSKQHLKVLSGKLSTACRCASMPIQARVEMAHLCRGCPRRQRQRSSAALRCRGSGRPGAAAWPRQRAPSHPLEAGHGVSTCVSR